MSNIRRGITLLELVLVMAVLLVLTGITVSLYPDLFRRSAITSSLESMNELAKAVQMVEALDGKMPNGFDSLVDTSTAAILITMRTSVAPTNFIVTTVGGLEGTLGVAVGTLVTAFSDRGLITLFNYGPPGTTSKTFGFEDGPGISGTSEIVAIAAGSEAKFGLPSLPVGLYVAFGLGSNCSLVGSAPGVLSAPVHTSHIPAENDPFVNYSRYLVVYKIVPDGLGGLVITFSTVVAPIEFGVPSDMGTADNYTALASTL